VKKLFLTIAIALLTFSFNAKALDWYAGIGVSDFVVPDADSHTWGLATQIGFTHITEAVLKLLGI